MRIDSATDQLTAKKPILKVDQLVKTYREERRLLKAGAVKQQALDGLSLEIDRGEFFGLVGASGSGKTTLGRLVLKLEDYDTGAILFDGMEIRHLKGQALKAFRRKVQMIPQDPYQALNPYLCVYDTVCEPLVIHRVGDRQKRRTRVAEALASAGLTPPEVYFHRYPHQLSGGQRQRAVIARAMVLDPEFVIADEPTSMLDATISFTIFKLLSDIRRKKNVTFLFITHDLAAANYLCGRIAVINNGRIVESGKTREVIDHPESDYTRTLIAAQPRFDFLKTVSAAHPGLHPAESTKGRGEPQ